MNKKSVKAPKVVDLGLSVLWGDGNLDGLWTLTEINDELANNDALKDYRLPTEEEVTELYENCMTRYSVKYNVREFVGNDNSIGFMFDGWRFGGALMYPRITGYYWTGSVSDELPFMGKAMVLTSCEYKILQSPFSNGMSVRLVKEREAK